MKMNLKEQWELEKFAAEYSSALESIGAVQRERDKQFFLLSSGGLGLLINLLHDDMSNVAFWIYYSAAICFFLCILQSLYLWRKTADSTMLLGKILKDNILNDNNSKDKVEKVEQYEELEVQLKNEEVTTEWLFVIGAILTILGTSFQLIPGKT